MDIFEPASHAEPATFVVTCLDLGIRIYSKLISILPYASETQMRPTMILIPRVGGSKVDRRSVECHLVSLGHISAKRTVVFVIRERRVDQQLDSGIQVHVQVDTGGKRGVFDIDIKLVQAVGF